MNAHLGDVAQDVQALLTSHATRQQRRAERMEKYAMIGLGLSAFSAFMVYNRFYGPKMARALGESR